MKYFQISIYFTVFIKLTGCIQLHTSLSTPHWHDAEETCQNAMYNFTGPSVFLDEDTILYNQNVVPKYNIPVANVSSPVWVNALRQTSKWIAHERCSFLNLEDVKSLEQYNLTTNGPGECYFACNDMKNNDRMALHNRTCYCITKDLEKLQSNTCTLPLASCGYKCSDGSLYYCGGDGHEDKIYMSVYETLQVYKENNENQNCGMYGRSSITTDCGERWSCLCGDRNNANRTELTSVTWDECNKNCSAVGKKVVTIDARTKTIVDPKINVTYWSGYFRIVKDVWLTSQIGNEKRDIKCLALNQTTDGNFTFVGLDCDTKLPALCYKGTISDTSTTEFTTINQSIEMSSIMTQINERQNSEQEMDSQGMTLLVGSVAGSVVLVTAMLVLSACVYQKRKRPTKETLSVKYTKENKPFNGDVYSEAVITEDGQNGINGIKQKAMEETDYDQLHTNRHDKTFSEDARNLYDHTGMKTEDEYDLTDTTKASLAHDQNTVNDYDTVRHDEGQYDSIKGDTVKKTTDESEYTM